VMEALSPERSVVQREVEGGTGPGAVRAQIEQAQAALAPPPTPRSTNAVG
jgi:argininosuccinate lyase